MLTQELDKDFFSLEEDGKLVLFVNAEKAPDKIEPLGLYTYAKDIEDRYNFYRLYKLSYRQTDGESGIYHSFLAVEPHFVAGLIQVIDAMKAAEAAGWAT